MGVMNATYNLTKLAESETILDVVTTANEATGSILLGVFVIALFFIIMMLLSRKGFDKALLVASFSGFIISLFLTYAGLLNFLFIIFFLAIMAFVVFYMVLVAKKGPP